MSSSSFAKSYSIEIKIENLDATRINDYVFGFWSDNREVLRVLLSADVDNRLSKKLGELTAEIVDINIQLNKKVKGVKAAYIVDFVSAGTFALLRRWIEGVDEVNPADLAEIVGEAADAIVGLAGEDDS